MNLTFDHFELDKLNAEKEKTEKDKNHEYQMEALKLKQDHQTIPDER